uniref:F-box associated domain-containing protein n=1 Tax=Lactuca sativa TaxID=4236 RepID=A0A9R1VH50_LACSA|nr:hypothetical protein LSAT_V11C500278790 [Lactuca sativa]
MIYSERIVAFDLCSETFSEIPLPESILHDGHHRGNVLGVLSEKLCVMSFSRFDTFEVWVMDEYVLAESWVKSHVFSQFIGDIYPYGFTSHSELLIDFNACLDFYDPFINEQKILEDHCLERDYVEKIMEYVDSLVWVAPAEHEMVNGGGQN